MEHIWFSFMLTLWCMEQFIAVSVMEKLKQESKVLKLYGITFFVLSIILKNEWGVMWPGFKIDNVLSILFEEKCRILAFPLKTWISAGNCRVRDHSELSVSLLFIYFEVAIQVYVDQSETRQTNTKSAKISGNFEAMGARKKCLIQRGKSNWPTNPSFLVCIESFT